jgi:hypothetical protein
MPGMAFSAARSLRQLQAQFGTMRSLSALPAEQLYATKAPSKWTPSEHLDHVTRVSLAMLEIALRPDAKPLPQPMNLVGRLILTIGWIPRGAGKAPARFHGVRVPTETLNAQLTTLESAVAKIDTRELTGRRVPTIPHPRFGGLTPEQALRFIAIHIEHHLRIIREILKP